MADRNGYIGRAPGDSSVTIARQTNTLTGVQTSFVFNSGYDVGYLDVFINGTKLINATDYQATDGQNVTLTVAGTSDDVLEFVAYKAFNLTNVITESSGDLTVNGSVTATSYSGDGSNLTGIDATSLKDENDTVRAQANTFGIVVTGVTTSTSFVGNLAGDVDGDVTGNLTGNVTGNLSGNATGLNGTPSITVEDVTAQTVSVAGRIVGAATNSTIPFLYSNLSDLPSASTYHGAFAHVHATGKAYFAHAGAWRELVTVGTAVTSGNVLVGTGITMYTNSGIVSATAFYGDGSNLENAGASAAKSSAIANFLGR